MKIRKATIKEINEIVNLAVEFHEEYFKKYKIEDHPTINTLKKQQKEIFEKDLKSRKGVVFFAEEGEKKVGYIFVIKGLQNKNVKSTAYISDLYVKKEFRGKGISKKLMKEGELWCKKQNLKKILLDTEVKNSRALKLYDKLNFKKTRIRLEKKLK